MLEYAMLRSYLERNADDLRDGRVNREQWCDRVHHLLTLRYPDAMRPRPALPEPNPTLSPATRMSTLLDTRWFEQHDSEAPGWSGSLGQA